MSREEELLKGGLAKSLIEYLPERELELINRIDAFSVQHIYNHRSVVEIEIAGYNVIGGMLREFFGALLQPDTNKSQKLKQLISKQFVIAGRPDSLYSGYSVGGGLYCGDDGSVCRRSIPEDNGDRFSADRVGGGVRAGEVGARGQGGRGGAGWRGRGGAGWRGIG